MALFEINTQPSNRQLRQFGLICTAAVPLLGWFWTGSLTAAAWGSLLGAVTALLAIVSPRLLQPIFVGLVFVTLPIGLIVGELILLTIFFGLFLPTAALFRILGRDALQRRGRAESTTFWQRRNSPPNVRRYFRQS